VLDLAKMISDKYDFIDKREGESEITFADVSKATRILGWKPGHSLEEYIKATISDNRL
jgi:nucleoside-diphosphate-sugar epimerase